MSRIIEAETGAARRGRRAFEIGRLLAAHVRAEAAEPDKARAIAARSSRATQKGDAPGVATRANVEKFRPGCRRRLELQGLLFHRLARPSMLAC